MDKPTVKIDSSILNVYKSISLGCIRFMAKV